MNQPSPAPVPSTHSAYTLGAGQLTASSNTTNSRMSSSVHSMPASWASS
ncbi:hypothetical protein [Corallococcus sp. RDP092CA]